MSEVEFTMEKLLIVDDEKREREGLCWLIDWESHGIKVSGTARNGFDALQQMRKDKPDIVIVDVRMPVMNGIEMIREAQKEFTEIIYVVLSGYGDYEYTSQAMELGVRHYLLKPCDEKKIIAMVKKVKGELIQQREVLAQREMFRNLSAPNALGVTSDINEKIVSVFDYQAIKKAESIEDILMEFRTAFSKMDLMFFSENIKKDICVSAFRVLINEEDLVEYSMESMVTAFVNKKNIILETDNNAKREWTLLLVLYKKLCDQDLSIQNLARNDFFMNEDYLGRLYAGILGERFTTYVEKRRISLAIRLLEYKQDIQVQQLAKAVGYPVDGNYFGKVFRKLTGKNPSQYEPV